MMDELMALSTAAHWNQNEADWRTMLELGHGWGVAAAAAACPPDGTAPPGGEADGGSEGGAAAPRLVASTLVLPYERRFAWVSMVLVLPEWRGNGLAAQLLAQALADLDAAGLPAVLDATPAGRPVYLKQGFVDGWGFTRWRRPGAMPLPAADRAPDPRVRRLRPEDWPAIAALDAPAFGASRVPLLQALADRLPALCWVLDDGAVRGFLMGREGRTAVQLGPLVADSPEDALALLEAALAAPRLASDRGAQLPPLIVDLPEGQPQLQAWLEATGFAIERPFTRMVRGAGGVPGDRARMPLVAGPELG